jgi:hypothetical protein
MELSHLNRTKSRVLSHQDFLYDAKAELADKTLLGIAPNACKSKIFIA